MGVNNKELLERAKHITNTVFGKDNVEIQLFDDEHCDPVIEFDCVAGVYWNEDTKKDEQWFQACCIIHDPGVFRHADGSGEPPGTELEDVGDLVDFDHAVLAALKLVLEYRLDDMLTSELEQGEDK